MTLTIILSIFFSALTITLVLFAFAFGVATGSNIRDKQFEDIEKMRSKLMNK